MTKVLAKKDSFVSGRFVPAGFVVEVPDGLKLGKNFETLKGDYTPDVIQNAAIAPTGPNPTAPQQIGPDTVQTVEGYAKPGARVVGEVTRPAEVRIEDQLLDANEGTEGDIDNLLADDRNVDNAGTEGTVADVVATIGPDTDLDALEAAEKDREVPRKGVLSAIDKERASRKS